MTKSAKPPGHNPRKTDLRPDAEARYRAALGRKIAEQAEEDRARAERERRRKQG